MPVICIVVCFFLISQIKLGLDLSGGTLLTAPVLGIVDAESLKVDILAEFDLEDLDVRTTTGAASEINIQFTGETTLLQAQGFLEAKDYAASIESSKKFTGTLNVTGDEEAVANAYFS